MHFFRPNTKILQLVSVLSDIISCIYRYTILLEIICIDLLYGFTSCCISGGQYPWLALSWVWGWLAFGRTAHGWRTHPSEVDEDHLLLSTDFWRKMILRVWLKRERENPSNNFWIQACVTEMGRMWKEWRKLVLNTVYKDISLGVVPFCAKLFKACS